MLKITSKLCMQKDLGVNGNLFGGNMMAWMDEAAAIFAHYITKDCKMVTRQFSELQFTKPVREGDIIDFFCVIKKWGITSVEIEINALKGSPLKESEQPIVFFAKATCVFVSVDKDGNKTPIKQRFNKEIA